MSGKQEEVKDFRVVVIMGNIERPKDRCLVWGVAETEEEAKRHMGLMNRFFEMTDDEDIRFRSKAVVERVSEPSLDLVDCDICRTRRGRASYDQQYYETIAESLGEL